MRGFADSVTLLDHGRVRFAGTVTPADVPRPAETLPAPARPPRSPTSGTLAGLQAALEGLGSIAPTADGGNDHYLLALHDRVLLGEAVARIRAAGCELLGCRDEPSEVEMAFLSLTRGADA